MARELVSSRELIRIALFSIHPLNPPTHLLYLGLSRVMCWPCRVEINK